MRDLALIVSVATDKPELLEAFESEARKRAETVRRRIRTTFVAALVAFLTITLGIALSLIVANTAYPEIAGGDEPMTMHKCVSAGDTDVCAPVYVYELREADAKAETRFSIAQRSASEQGKGQMHIETDGCDGEGRAALRVSVADVVVADAVANDDSSPVEFPIAAGQEFTVAMQRVDSGNCALQLRVDRFFVAFD